jgi:hypothetical protein
MLVVVFIMGLDQTWLVKVECLIGELNKNFKRKRRVDFLNFNIYI